MDVVNEPLFCEHYVFVFVKATDSLVRFTLAGHRVRVERGNSQTYATAPA